MNRLFKNTFLVIFFLFYLQVAFSQISSGGEPVSFSIKCKKNIKKAKIKAKLVESLIEAEKLSNKQNPSPFIFGVNIDVKYNMLNSGTVEKLDDGAILWRLKIKSEHAYSIGVFFGTYILPPEAKLFFYTPDQKEIRGAFTFENNKTSNKLPIAQIPGDTIILEYYEPENAEFPGELEITKIIHDYTGTFGKKE